MRVDDATQESWWLESREASSRRQLRLDRREANREVGVDPRRGSQHQRNEAAWDRVQREESQDVCDDRVQREESQDVALWNFR